MDETRRIVLQDTILVTYSARRSVSSRWTTRVQPSLDLGAPVLIRQEAAIDYQRIDTIHRSAFADQAPGGEPVEVGLVRELRSDVGYIPALSLVAENTAGTVIGHVICTLGHLEGARAVGLGPIGVEREHQSGGVGAALMHAVLSAADALEFDVVVLLGHVDYYPRFGFVTASTVGITAPDPEWGDHFQARRLSRWTTELRGQFHYAEPFERL